MSLILRVGHRDPAAWERLVHLYGAQIYGWCRQSGLQPSDAEDVSQEVFNAVANSIDRFVHAGANGAFRGWLWTITRSKMLDHFRGKNRRPAAVGGTDFNFQANNIPEVLSEEPPSEPSQERALQFRALDLLRDEFQENTWQAFWRLSIGNESSSEIAASLGMTSKAVRQAKYRVVQRLRSEFGELLDISFVTSG